jgi:hypothetical protein
MAMPPGNYDLKYALNHIHPATARAKLGDILDTLIRAHNALMAQSDVGLAVDGGATYNTGGGTLTVGGTIANGNWFTVTFVNPSMPLLVTPGLIVGPINIVTADTTTTVATKLAAAINANQTLTNYGVVASSSAAVVTVKVLGAVAASTVMTAQLSAGAAITVTPANPTGGAGTVVSRNAAAFPLTPLSLLP